MTTNRLVYKFILVVFCITQLGYVFLFKIPSVYRVSTANLTSASATLSNPRLSYKAGVTTAASGATNITIDGSGNADNDTNHLFPKDTICIANDVESGCRGTAPAASKTYSVDNVIDSTNFTIGTALTTAGTSSDYVVATQSGTMTITFTTASDIPSNGDLLITIPAVNTTGKTSDGFPDTASSIATNGFDIGSPTGPMGASNITVTAGCTPGNWTVGAVSAGTSSADHTIRIDRSSSTCTAGSTITLVVGDATKPLINPAPISTGHTQGTADTYTITVQSRDGSDQVLDDVDMKVAAVEGVLVSATVDETLNFTVAGVASSQSTCGQTTDITTTAYSVPWGTISTTNSFLEGSQQLTVSTNASGGYTVKIEENDQMGKNGVTCTGATAGESVSCIKDTTCNGAACSESTSAEWTTATNNGLGYSLANVSGTDATFLYNESARTFSAKQIADQEASESKQSIMSNSVPVSGSSAYVCYRISVSGTQPAGYYYNKVKYTATGTF